MSNARIYVCNISISLLSCVGKDLTTDLQSSVKFLQVILVYLEKGHSILLHYKEEAKLFNSLLV